MYAEAQLRVPEQVLDLAGGLSHDLGAVYGMVRRPDDGVPGPGDSPAAVRESIDELWDGCGGCGVGCASNWARSGRTRGR